MRRSSAATAALVIGVLAAGNAAVIAATDVSPIQLGSDDRSASIAQYKPGESPSRDEPPGCDVREQAHMRAETKLAARQQTSRQVIRRSNRQRLKRARRNGARPARIRRIKRQNRNRYTTTSRVQKKELRTLKRRNRTDERGRGCKRPTNGPGNSR